MTDKSPVARHFEIGNYIGHWCVHAKFLKPVADINQTEAAGPTLPNLRLAFKILAGRLDVDPSLFFFLPLASA